MTRANSQRMIWRTLLLVLLTAAAAQAAAAPLYLVRDGQAAATIVVAKAEGREANLISVSASLLQTHIKRITGANLPRVEDGKSAMAIPWSDFGRKPASGEVWRAQFGRIDIRDASLEISSWAPTTKGLNNADDLGVLLFE